MKRILSALISMIMLTGCASGNISNREYIRGIYIGADEISVGFYGEDREIFSSENDSPETICETAALALGKEIFTGHTELIVLGDCDRRKVLEYLLREWKVSPSCVVISGDELPENDKIEQTAESVRIAEKMNDEKSHNIVAVLKNIKKQTERSNG